MMAGTILMSPGACPVCGELVKRAHGWNGTTLTDRYACTHCGETAYSVTRTPATS